MTAKGESPMRESTTRASNGRGLSAFGKNILRTIRGSLGRFCAILGIVALGCGFYAGLQMCGPDMRSAADELYDGTNLYDIRIVSTLGFTESDVERVSTIKGVESTMPAISCDVMARLGSEQLAVRMSRLDVDAARAAQEQGANVILSSDGNYLNRVFLRDGRWPEDPDECVITADKPVAGIGIGDTIEVLYGTVDLKDVLEARSFKVVGTVSSSNYPYTGSFGSTTLGSGMIGEYVYVAPSAFVEDAPFTEMYLRVAGADAYESGSDKYQKVVDKVRHRIEINEDILARARLRDVKIKAQEELDEAYEEYEEERKKAADELADAKRDLDDAREQVQSGSDKYDKGFAEYKDGVNAYNKQRDEAQRKLNDAQRKLDDAQAQVNSQVAQLKEGEAQLAEGKKQYEEGVAAVLAQTGATDLAGARAMMEGQQAEIEAATAQLLQGLAAQGMQAATLEEAQVVLEQTITQMQAAGMPQEMIAPLTAALESVQQLLSASPAVVEGLQGIATLEAAKAELDASEAQLKDGRSKLIEAQKTINAGQTELNQQREEAARQLASARNQLADAAAKLSDASQELTDGKTEYEDGITKYDDGNAEALEKLADAKDQLTDAQREIDELEAPDIYVLDRSQNEGALTYDADSHRIDSIADVFPFIFFLVAALVALTTMTRMVEDDRIEIGTYKALGYSTARIASKYLIYAGLAGIVGATVGIAALSQVLPYIVTTAYSIIYSVPLRHFPLPIDLGISLISGGLGVGVTLAATWAAVVASLREVPANLMLPRAPKSGKRILLERIGFIWRNLSFSWKVTCRNLFRYKRRLTMTVIGISGCTALLLVGFGLHDAIWDIIDGQYGPIIHYDTTVGLDADATEIDVDNVVTYLDGTGEVTGITRVQQENMQAGVDSDEETIRVQVVIPRDKDELAQAVTFRNRVSHELVAFDDDAVVITEKLSLKYGLGVGDTILLFDQDAIGNITGEGHKMRITGVAENYVGNLVYVGRDAWKTIDEDLPVFSTIYASTTEDEDVRKAIADKLHDRDDVSIVIYSDETINLYRNMLSVVDMIVVVLIVSAALLAFIVLYNLTNINIGERIREIASLKVLGFTRREVYAYIYREIGLLAVLGDALGMVLGTYLETFVATTAEVDYVMFGRTIHPLSYLYAFALTLVFTGLILLLMRHKLDKVDMVESLKSVD